MMSYTQRGASERLARVPLTGVEVPIHDNLVDRRAELAARDERGTLETVARMLAVLHAECAGHVETIAGEHTPRFVRFQLLGQRALGLVDLVHMILTAPAARRCLDPLLEVFDEGRCPWLESPATGDFGTLSEEVADVSESYAATLASWAHAIADGRITHGEAASLRHCLDDQLRQTLELRSVVDRYLETAL